MTNSKPADKEKKYLSADEREKLIVDTAIMFVSKKGFKFTTRELAESIGMTQPLLYRYFKNKQKLIDRIFDEVFLRRWNPDWEVLIRNREIPLRERLKRYLTDYTKSILDEEWIRVFLVSAFDDPIISQKYIAILHEKIFSVLIEEIATENGLKLSQHPDKKNLATELIWGFHSSFFYLGVRKYIYRLPIPKNIEAIVDMRVDVFLDGAIANIHHLTDQ
ncbi:TetR/AcrR family transcriptional regulator [Motiliproteus sp. MSK22-1]|uniref:TetR/AcrR family transcriptional regulator n=1 Tax=Motiliproteus sp. MSK22-1 TaxID=1897630 RepID=UPI000976BAB7|nr:TetR/AcrR family transcriptional regulator [Motiliproteus sp. MSK22-1]OMH36219.1 hypothetical protein BGP75_09700 [Motiliproteus sp. MSK22-1]